MMGLLKKGLREAKKIYHQDRYVLSRTACLGQDIFKLKYNQAGITKNLINLQKVRGDMFADLLTGKNRPRPEIVEPFMARKDVFPMIVEQERFEWINVKHSANFILLDSFSELTDQKFVHKKEGWAFCCNYTDIEHTAEFESMFECRGLIDIDDLEHIYASFFATLYTHYPRKKLIFIHFPTILDPREKFGERGKRILDILLEIEKKNKNLKNIFVKDSLVQPHPGDDFPYHYGIQTQMAFLQQWK